MCTHNICFEQKYEKSKKFQMKIVIFTAVKNRCMLHGRVFIMPNVLHIAATALPFSSVMILIFWTDRMMLLVFLSQQHKGIVPLESF